MLTHTKSSLLLQGLLTDINEHKHDAMRGQLADALCFAPAGKTPHSAGVRRRHVQALFQRMLYAHTDSRNSPLVFSVSSCWVVDFRLALMSLS